MSFDDSELTRDAFLGGRLQIRQPRRGYRAGIDPVLLAAAVPARPGQSVLELGCGAGPALLCLAARVPGLAAWGLELQPGYAALARRNAAENGLQATICTGDVTAPPDELRGRQFDHVLANPPYFPAAARTAAADPGREAGRGEAAPLSAWVTAGLRRLAPRGTLSVIQRADRLPELLAAGPPRGGRLRPIAPREGRAASLVLAQWVKGGGAAFRLLPPLVLHEGPRHLRDGDDYRAEITAILRDGAALSWGE